MKSTNAHNYLCISPNNVCLAAAAGSKTYILRSTLDPLIIELAALTDEHILEEEAVDAPSDDDDDDMFGPRSYGSIISWSTADQLGPIGVLYIILALILVSGRVMSDGEFTPSTKRLCIPSVHQLTQPTVDLRANLKRLRLPPTSSLNMNAHSTHRSMPIDTYLTQLLKQGFLDRQRVGDNKKGKGGGKNKRVRSTQGGDNDDEGMSYEWRWGNRAQSEVGEKGIAEFVAEFMVGEGMHVDADEDEEDGGAGRARAKKRLNEAEHKLAKSLKGIERAAGGNLADLK